MPATASIWIETFRVRSYEADRGGLASIQTVCNYLQEAAANHAADLGLSIDRLEQDNLTWVLARLRVKMDAYPCWRQDVTVETWPSGVDRLYATREFLIRNGSGNVIARATSAWLLIDVGRRRPVRMPEFVSAIVRPDRERALDDLPAKLPDVAETGMSHPVSVRYSDLDMNGHVNNVLYAEWSIESVPVGVLQTHTVRTLDLHFRAEATFGDHVVVATEMVEDSPSVGRTFSHVIRSGDRELARAQTSWVRK